MAVTHLRKCIGKLRQDNAQNSTEQVMGRRWKQDRDKIKPFIPAFTKTFVPSSLKQIFSDQQHWHQRTWVQLLLVAAAEWNGRCFQPDFCLLEHSTLSVLAPQYQGNSKINACASEWDLHINHQEGGQLCKAHSSHPGLHLAQKVMKWCVTPGSSCDRHPSIGSGMEMWESLAQSYLSCTTLTLSPLHSLPLKP